MTWAGSARSCAKFKQAMGRTQAWDLASGPSPDRPESYPLAVLMDATGPV